MGCVESLKEVKHLDAGDKDVIVDDTQLYLKEQIEAHPEKTKQEWLQEMPFHLVTWYIII